MESQPRKKMSDKAAKREDKKEQKRIKGQIMKMKALGLLVKEVIETGIPRVKGSKPSVEHPGVKSAVNILKGLNSANCKIEFFLASYKKIYEDHRRDILNSFEKMYWMTTIVVKAHLGDVKHGACLHLSMAMNSAMKMRKAIEDRKYSNPNDKEEALGDYKYGYVSLLHYRFLDVTIDALGSDHKDITRLTNLLEQFKAETHINSGSSSDEDSGDAPSLGKTVTKMSGENHTSKSIEKTINSMVGNVGALEKVQQAVKDMSAADGNPLENPELLTKTVTSLAPMFSGIFESMTSAHKNDESSESGDSSEDSSSASS